MLGSGQTHWFWSLKLKKISAWVRSDTDSDLFDMVFVGSGSMTEKTIGTSKVKRSLGMDVEIRSILFWYGTRYYLPN